jgi:hypothetical protein
MEHKTPTEKRGHFFYFFILQIDFNAFFNFLDGIQIGELIAIFGLTLVFIVVLATVVAIVAFKKKNK